MANYLSIILGSRRKRKCGTSIVPRSGTRRPRLDCLSIIESTLLYINAKWAYSLGERHDVSRVFVDGVGFDGKRSDSLNGFYQNKNGDIFKLRNV
jgi:hypothetical protein